MKRELVYDVIIRQKKRGYWIERYSQDEDKMTYQAALATYRYFKDAFGARDDVEFELVRLTYAHDDKDLCEIGELVDTEIIYRHSFR